MDFLTSLGPAIIGAVSQGVLFGIMALAVYISYRILKIADLTVDGSFSLGACVCAVMLTKYRINPILVLLISAGFGMLAGIITGLMNTVFEIPMILAGILTQISLWSFNLHLMKKSNISLANTETIFSSLSKVTGLKLTTSSLIFGVFISVCIVAFLYWFFGTEIGASIRATGDNEKMVRALGFNTNFAKVLALLFSNALVSLSGALVSQSQRYADINMGTGAIVIGLASIVIGEVFFSKYVGFIFKFSSVVVGSIIFFIIRAIVLRLGLDPNYMKALSAFLVFLALAFPVLRKKLKLYFSRREKC